MLDALHLVPAALTVIVLVLTVAGGIFVATMDADTARSAGVLLQREPVVRAPALVVISPRVTVAPSSAAASAARGRALVGAQTDVAIRLAA